jgi:hypothetical protein
MRLRTTTCLAIVCAIAAASPALGQRYIEGGNALDANPMVGSGGLNFANRPPPINAANAIMTGNVGRGAAFRGFSPIRDPGQFSLGLPSSGLSTFRADGVSVADLLAGQSNFAPRMYYDPSRSVTNVGALRQNIYQPGISVPRNPYASPWEDVQPIRRDPVTFRQLNNRQATGQGMALEPAMQRSIAGTLSAEPTVNQRLLSSPLFARGSLVPLSQLGANGARAGRVPMEVQPPERSSLSQQSGAGPMPSDLRVNERLDYRINAAYDGRTSPDGAGFADMPRVTQKPLIDVLESEAPLDLQAPPKWLGEDRFRDMAAIAEVIDQRFRGQPKQSAGPGTADAEALAAHAGWVREYMSKPVTSFAGTAPTKLNDYLHRAEQEMRSGRYYSASRLYELASTIDPDSPLPVVGRAHALIAAGEYMTAVTLLTRTIDRYPNLAYFQIDLRAFITDLRDIDRRRADLERLLEANDDHRLRFLLGYMEYYSGFSLPGLENLAKAAAKAPEGSAITRFPQLLKQAMSVPLEAAK